MRHALLAAFASFTPLAQVSEKTPGWFAFTMSPFESLAGTPVDASFLNAGPADSRISVKGPYFVDTSGERVRFIGTNLTFEGVFPEKKHATAIANRMAQLGFNVVRFHHMDARDIWLPGQKELDPAKVDLLDWLIAELKRNGIYSNINLHVSRTYPGLKEMKADRSFRYGKIVDKFHEPYIALQRKYAEDLLDHVNSYTKLKLSEDPAVAFVELNNENTLLQLDARILPLLPDPLRASLTAKWRTWLAKEYRSLDALKAKWAGELIPLGEEILKNGDFAKGGEDWSMEGLQPETRSFGKLADGTPTLRIRIKEKGKVSWAYQIHQLGLTFQEGTTYTMRLRGRANPARRVSVALRFAEPPWTILSSRAAVGLTPEWQEFTLVSKVTGAKADIKQRFSLNLADAVGDVEFAGVSLRTGNLPFKPGKGVHTIADLPLPIDAWPAAAWADFRRFLIGTERSYVKQLKQYVVGDLGVKSLVIDTQASYGGVWGLHREATLSDYIDMHAYWQHPQFPGKPWDGNNWRIPNTSMVAAPVGRSTFERLASSRLESLPFSVSEYDHPAPNDHAAEMFPMFAAFASHQDWDALYQFCYGIRQSNYENPRIDGYFHLGVHPGQLVFAPIAAIAFRQGLIPRAGSVATLTIPEPYLHKTVSDGYFSLSSLVGEGVFSREQQIASRFAVAFSKGGETPKLTGRTARGGSAFSWQREGERPQMRVSAPAVRMAVGEIGGQTIRIQDLSITTRPSDGNWVAFAIAAADGKPLAESRKAILALCTRTENSYMLWKEDRTTLENKHLATLPARDRAAAEELAKKHGRRNLKWGSNPVVAQGVPATLILPGTAKPRVTALDAQGKPTKPVPVTGKPGAWTVELGPVYKTLWYAVER